MAESDENQEGTYQTNQIFSFDCKDLEVEAASWPNDSSTFRSSMLDVKLKEAWDKASADGAFWYDLNGLERKKIDGALGLYAQLNTKRFAQRRKPEEANRVLMPFDEAKFNFTKIKEKEVLFQIQDKDSKNKNDCHLVIINVSPIEYGHVLLVPNIYKGQPQVLDIDAVKLATQLCLLSKHRGFRLGFNSLCALASVNHQHLHAFYINYELPIDKVTLLRRKGGLFVLEDYIVRGYAFQFDENVEYFARQVATVTNYFCQNNIAHNLFICRGKRASDDLNTQNTCFTVTVFIFPKQASTAINDQPFNVAFLEIGGFLPIRDKDEYDSITENSAIEILNKYTYREDEFERLTDELTFLLKRMVIAS